MVQWQPGESSSRSPAGVVPLATTSTRTADVETSTRTRTRTSSERDGCAVGNERRSDQGKGRCDGVFDSSKD